MTYNETLKDDCPNAGASINGSILQARRLMSLQFGIRRFGANFERPLTEGCSFGKTIKDRMFDDCTLRLLDARATVVGHIFAPKDFLLFVFRTSARNNVQLRIDVQSVSHKQ